MYSGPEPPSGGVRRPPFAVIAPHCTQFDGLSRTVTVPLAELSSVFASGNKTRDDQPSHIRVQEKVPRELAVAWEWMCPAKVYEIDEQTAADGTVSVRVNASNCVQCGAITAKGGRLTPPEGGSGPEYTLT